jgi:hypothetical protein
LRPLIRMVDESRPHASLADGHRQGIQ